MLYTTVCALLINHSSIDSAGNVPSAPLITSATSTTTSITLTWFQPSGEGVTSFAVSYIFEVRGCPGVRGSNTRMISNNSVSIGNSMYQYSVIGLPEYSDTTLTVTATNTEGTSPESFPTRIDTLQDGKCTSDEVDDGASHKGASSQNNLSSKYHSL